MGRRAMAPTLHEYMVGIKASADRACEWCSEWAEYRALLAVARAAQRVELLHKRQWNGPGAIARKDMARALARLDALSGRAGRRKGSR